MGIKNKIFNTLLSVSNTNFRAVIHGAGRKDRSSGTRVEESSDVTNMRSALFSSVPWISFT